MSKTYEWALIRDGEIVALYRTEIGARRAATVFNKHIRAVWTVKHVHNLFTEIENANAQ